MNDESTVLATLWAELGENPADLPAVSFEGAAGGLPSVYAVSPFAAASVAVASAAAAALWGKRTRTRPRAVHLDRRHAAAAFRSERYLEAVGWQLPPVWDPIAGDYAASDGFVRLHTNYAHHRHAALRALSVPEDRDAVKRRVEALPAEQVERDVVAAGGCAAMLRTAAEWAAHPQGRAVAAEPLVAVRTTRAVIDLALSPDPAAPLEGVRVLDLTRVIAGPVCTRFLAAYGADVLRIDPPGFEEVPALLGDSTGGKRRASLDLRDPRGRAAFERLVGEAHLVVHGYRSDALARLGLGAERLSEINPSLCLVTHDAYGFTGPWAQRRGFDSLVQMSAGIAARGRDAAGGSRPAPLPAQALDHGTGYLLAAAACRALARALDERRATESRLSLARTAHFLTALGDDGDPSAPDLTAEEAAPFLERVDSTLGTFRRVRCPGRIEGITPSWRRAPGPLGSDPPAWG